MRRSKHGVILSVTTAVFVAGGLGVRPAAGAEEKKRDPIYNEKADAKADIAKAVAKAERDNKRVLLMWGGNWCGWCWKLHDVFKEDKDIARTLRAEYEVVLIDINNNRPLSEHYKIEGDKGVPYLTVLDGDGKVVKNQNTGDLEKGKEHDRGKVLAFLKAQQPEPLDAEKVLKAALVGAKKEDKKVFVHIGSPGCGWCHKLADVLHREDVEEIVERDYLIVKIDLQRMTNGSEVGRRLRAGGGGIPWYVILDAKGEKLITSDGKDGNIGYPTNDDDLAHFRKMLTKTAKRLSAEQVDTIADAFKKKPDKPKPEPKPEVSARAGG